MTKPKPPLPPVIHKYLVKRISLAFNVTRSAARQLLDREIIPEQHHKDCTNHRDQWLHRRGLIP